MHGKSNPPAQTGSSKDGSEDERLIPHALPFYLPYVVPLITVLAHYSRVEWHALIAPIIVWVVVPLMDYIVGKSCTTFSHRFSAQQRRKLESNLWFKLAVLLWCPTQLGILLWAARRVQQVEEPVTGLRLVGLVWSTSLVASEGINCAHELLHRRSTVELFVGKLLLLSVLYGHFNIEHTRGHHSRVATHEDPATFRYGESFYHFLPRTVIGGYVSAWRLELARLKRYKYSLYGYRNEMIVSGLLQVGLCAGFYCLLGMRALLLFLFQAGSAILLLEQFNAIEHYGLSRKLTAMDASKRYQVLELTDGSPQLPAGYLSLAPLLLVPPAWRFVMDDLLHKYWKKWDELDKTTSSTLGKESK